MRRTSIATEGRLMSIGRTGARTAILGFGVIASMMLAASPSWAGHGKRPGAICKPGAYPGVLFAADGSAFSSTHACKRYVKEGGQLGGVDAIAEPPVGGSFSEMCSGFGLEPSTANRIFESRCGVTYSNGDAIGQYGPQEANGTWAVSTSAPCTFSGGTVVSLVVIASALDGSTVERDFPPPNGCSSSKARSIFPVGAVGRRVGY